MSIEERLTTTLGPMFSGSFWPDIAPQDCPYPYCTYQQVGGVPVNALCGDSNVNARIQFNVWAATRDEASTLMKALAVVVTEAPFRAVSQGGLVAEYNAVTKGRGARRDFSFWFTQE